MTTINRDRDNAGQCHTVGAGSLLTSDELYAEARTCQAAGYEFSDTAAATVASWWHSPKGDGAVFSRLSHRIAGGSDVAAVLDAIYRAQRKLDSDTRVMGELEDDRLALNMLATWAINGPGPEHCNYPHFPGSLYDCPACDAACHCTPDSMECVFEGEHNGTASE